MDVFWVLMLLSLAAVPLAMSLRKVKLGGGPRQRRTSVLQGPTCQAETDCDHP